MELLELGKNPISSASPAGKDARYEPEYESLQQQIDKLSSASAGGEIDWNQVSALCQTLLSEKTKDLKVAAYLGVALLRLGGAAGLSDGVQILHDLVDNFWENMQPEKSRLRGRLNALSWWQDHAETFLTNYAGDEIPRETVELLGQRLRDFDAALSALTPDAPVLSRLIEYADGLPSPDSESPASTPPEPPAASPPPSTSAAPPKPTNVSSPPPASSASTISTVSGAPSASPQEEASRLLVAGLSGLGDVADILLQIDTTDPLGYRLRRLSSWLRVTSLPPAAGGRTMIPDPDSEALESVTRLLAAGNYEDALRASEALARRYLFWLDLSRLSAEALAGLGDSHRDARLALEAETRFFTARLHGLEALSFAEGTPFADAKTQAWLGAAPDVATGGGVPAGRGDSAQGQSGPEKAMAEATRLAREGKAFDAVTLLQSGLASSASGRDRFQLRLGMIRLLTGMRQGALARAHVEQILETIQQHRLEEWEPELALSGFTAAHDALVAEGGEEALALAKSTLQRIGRVNPVAALRMNQVN